ncbi:universal stress protein [Pontibacter virosus]|uniref:Nucleotide-binding universal stress UspA family protein n=1 Tax=Pontibacter virosus TaxID=1765052 RepID=A0A2U1B0Q9_9BACT|nr:universal stress protein [Pontibacter virosus]PVY42248.1 nucleotide-binding universal stress UspA family protein [Pontibacter virosus]
MEKKLNIMVPVDFTPVSYKSLQFLNLVLEKAPVNLHLVHVIQVNAAEWAGNTDSSESIDRARLYAQEQQANQQFDELRKQAGIDFTSAVLYGGLTTSLTKYAEQQQADLIIMGTEGADGWYERMSGSEAQHVVRYTHIPVITIQQDASITPIKNLLWVADFAAEKQPVQSVNTIKTLQQLFGAQLHLLQIIDKGDEPKLDSLEAGMQRFAEKLHLQNYELHFKSDDKVPAGVRNFNRETEMDLVLIGTHGRKGFSHIFYGSIAETLVNHCIRPLLTYHLN